MKKLIGDSVDPEAAFAELFIEKPKELDRLLRYVTTIERAYYRALNKLEKLQKERARSTGLQPVNAFGFVLQNTKAAVAAEPARTVNSEKPRAFHAGAGANS